MPCELDATNIAIRLCEGGYVLVVHYGVPAAKTDINYGLAGSRTLGTQVLSDQLRDESMEY